MKKGLKKSSKKEVKKRGQKKRSKKGVKKRPKTAKITKTSKRLKMTKRGPKSSFSEVQNPKIGQKSRIYKEERLMQAVPGPNKLPLRIKSPPINRRFLHKCLNRPHGYPKAWFSPLFRPFHTYTHVQIPQISQKCQNPKPPKVTKITWTFRPKLKVPFPTLSRAKSDCYSWRSR